MKFDDLHQHLPTLPFLCLQFYEVGGHVFRGWYRNAAWKFCSSLLHRSPYVLTTIKSTGLIVWNRSPQGQELRNVSSSLCLPPIPLGNSSTASSQHTKPATFQTQLCWLQPESGSDGQRDWLKNALPFSSQFSVALSRYPRLARTIFLAT